MRLLRSWLKSEVFLVLSCLVFAVILRFYPALFSGQTLVFGDNYSLMVPGKIFTAAWLRQGILPLWNPLIFSGLPWLADINQSVLYISTLFFTWFQPAIALNINLLFHWAVAFIGAYLLGKQWTGEKKFGLLAGSLWLFSTHVSGSSNNFSTLQSLVWLPLMSYCGVRLFEHRQWSWWFAVVVTLQFLGGYPQHVLYSILAAVWLSAIDQFGRQSQKLTWKNVGYWLGVWAGTGVFVVGLSAVAWVPFVQMLKESTRMVQTAEQATVGSLDLPMLLVKPWLAYGFDKPVAGIKWGPAWSGQPNVVFYLTWVGLISLGLKFLLKRDKLDQWFFWPIISSLIFALGGNLPGFAQLQTFIPFLKIARYPSMILIVTNLGLIIWLLQTWKTWSLPKWWSEILVKLSGVIAILSTVGLWIAHSKYFSQVWQFLDSTLKHKLSGSGFHTLERDQLIAQMILENLVVVAALSVMAFKWLQTKQWFRLWIVVTLELWYCTQAMFFFAPRSIYDYQSATPSILSAQVAQGWQYRSLTRNVNEPYADYGTYWEAMVVRRPFSDSFVTADELKTFKNLTHLRDGYTPDWNLAWNKPMVHGYTTLLPQDYDAIWRASVKPTVSPRINFLIETPLDNALLREWSVKYYVVDKQFQIKEDLSGLPLVSQDRNWEVREIPGALARFRFDDSTPANLSGVVETPNQISFTLQNFSPQSAHLIMADRYDKSWHATINGQTAVIENYRGMRRLSLQPGENKITLNYQSKSAYFGLWITLATLVGFLAITVFVCLTKRR